MNPSNYTIQDVAGILKGTLIFNNSNTSPVQHLLTDSRKIVSAPSSLFFAIKGDRRDGHEFIDDLYHSGVRNFVISDGAIAEKYNDCNFIITNDTLLSLQQLAAQHRSRFSFPVIGITGSNGKTIVKEWLYQLLREDHHIVRSPKSYNSQIGDP